MGEPTESRAESINQTSTDSLLLRPRRFFRLYVHRLYECYGWKFLHPDPIPVAALKSLKRRARHEEICISRVHHNTPETKPCDELRSKGGLLTVASGLTDMDWELHHDILQ